MVRAIHSKTENRPASGRSWTVFDGEFKHGYRIDPQSSKCSKCKIIKKHPSVPDGGVVLCGWCQNKKVE